MSLFVFRMTKGNQYVRAQAINNYNLGIYECLLFVEGRDTINFIRFSWILSKVISR